jgi:hypothetical protein
MDGDRSTQDRLDRIEHKLDRMLQLTVCVLICQPILLVGILMPGVASLAVAYVLVALIIALALFPDLETKLPALMHRMGAFVGRAQRRWRGPATR